MSNIHYGGKSLGQIVDEIADQNFAKGMDAYNSGKMALMFVLEILSKTEVALLKFLSHEV